MWMWIRIVMLMGKFIFFQSFFLFLHTDTDIDRMIRAGGAMSWDWLRLERCSW